MQIKVALLLYSFVLKLELIFATIQLKDENYTAPLNNETRTSHPQIIKEHWKGHNEELELVYSDQYVAFYFDSFMQTTVFFYHYETLSDAWRYATEMYGPFVTNSETEGSSQNATLHFVLHQSKHFGCQVSNFESYQDPQFDFRFTIDCGSLRWHESLFILIKEVGKIIQLLAKATGNFPGKKVTKLSMYRILVYDILQGIGKHDDARKWLESHLAMNSTEEYSKRETLWFRDWFYPVYTNFGGSTVLNNFFEKLALFWPRKENGRDYDGQMNLGEFIHFWSGAAGKDLNDLAVRTFGWTAEDFEQFENATRFFPNLNYSRETDNLFLPPEKWNVPHRFGNTLQNEIFLSSSDGHVAFYTNLKSTNETLNNKPFPLPQELLSEGWKYSKEEYGPFGPDPILYIIIREIDTRIESATCTFSRQNSYFDTDYDNRNVIDCQISSKLRYKSSSVINELLVHPLMEIMGGTILRNYGETGNWLALKVSDWRSFQTILAYDVFFSGRVSNTNTSISTNVDVGQNWLQKRFVDRKWLRDWYFPVYEKYGGNVVLKKFLNAVNSNWPKKAYNYVKEMKLGEYIHFWSEAAETNLWYFAANAFSWNLEHHKDYFDAISEFPLLQYPGTYPNSTMPIPSVTWKESWFGQKEQRVEQSGDKDKWEEHKEDLTLAYIDQFVAIYFDSEVEASVKWPFKPLSDAWKYVQETFGPFGPDPILYIILHEGSHSRCISFRKDIPNKNSVINTTEIVSISDRIIIDCGQAYGGWSTPAFLQHLLFKITVIYQRAEKQVANCPFKEVGSVPELLLMDLLFGIGRREDAVNLLKEKTYLHEYQYPMYELYGRTRILQNMYKLLYENWPKEENGCGYSKQFAAGEFYHFWSGSTGVNVKYLDEEWWFDKFERLFQKARRDYPQVKYNESKAAQIFPTNPLLLNENTSWFGHDELLFLDYEDKLIAIYTDVDFHRVVHWPIPFLSKAWKQIQNTYKLLYQTSVLPSPYLHVILHERRSHCKCEISWGESRTQTNKKVNLTHVIDCGRSYDGWKDETQENTDTLMEALGSTILKSAFIKGPTKHCDASPSPYLNRKNNDCRVYLESPQIDQIIVYDIYLREGRFKDALHWLKKCIRHVDIQSQKEILWMRNWYLPIYTNYGGVATLDRYLSILTMNGSALIESHNERSKVILNTGETVHLWSAAAEVNLIQNGAFAFGWTESQENQFDEARSNLGNLHYFCYDCRLTGKEQQRVVLTGFFVSSGIAILITFLILFFWHRSKIRKLQSQIRQLTSEELQEFFEGTTKDGGENGCSSPESAPFNMEFEIPKNQLCVDSNKVLGSGEYGLVLYGTMEEKPVAVKTVKSDVDISSFKTLLTELKVICFLGCHDNIASLVGAVTVNIKNRELFMALEFCAKGDLLGYMKKHRQNFINLQNEISNKKKTASVDVDTRDSLLTEIYQFVASSGANVQLECENKISKKEKRKTSKTDSRLLRISSLTNIQEESCDYAITNVAASFSTLDLIEWAIQVSNGMDYISSKKVIHGDLAARNVLLTVHNVAKISDFGLSRQLSNYTNYMKKTQTPLPWRWMAIESLRDMEFSVESDVWSFGVTLYEIFALGTAPYAGYNWSPDFLDELTRGLRLKSPEYGNDDIFHLMMDCMKEQPSKRITFNEIRQRLQNIKSNFTSKDSV